MLKKIIAAITCSSVILSAMCGSVFAENERWYDTYIPYLYSPNVTNSDFWNFHVSYETDEKGALTEEAPWVILKLQNQEVPEGIDIDTSEEYFKYTNSGDLCKRVPNGFGYNWADVCYASGDVKVTVDGKEVEFPDVKPFIDINGRTMVPLRFVSEALGAEVKDWRQHASDPWNVFKCKMYWNTLGRKLYSAIDDPEGVFVKVPVYIDTGDMEITIRRGIKGTERPKSQGGMYTVVNGQDFYGVEVVSYCIGDKKITHYKHNLKTGEHIDYPEIEIDSVGFLKDNRTYIPLRFFSEVLGAKVDWDEDNRTVVITSAEN